MKSVYQAILFDFDGVIVLTEEVHARAKRLTLDRYGISYPETLLDDFKGRPDRVFWQYVSQTLSNNRYTAAELDDFKRSVFFGLADEILLVPGALKYVAYAKKNFRYLGLVSSATEVDLMVSERKFNFIKWFDCILLGEHTDHHKPHPEPYLQALKKLGLAPSEVLVIEDAPNGILSAKSAGCFVIGLTTSFTARDLTKAGADTIADSYVEIADSIKKVHPGLI